MKRRHMQMRRTKWTGRGMPIKGRRRRRGNASESTGVRFVRFSFSFLLEKKSWDFFFPFFGPLLCSGRGCRVRRRPVSAAAFEGRGRRPSTARPSTVHRRRWGGGGLKEKMRPTDQSGVALEWFEFERTFMGVPDWFSTGRSPIRSLARHGGWWVNQGPHFQGPRQHAVPDWSLRRTGGGAPTAWLVFEGRSTNQESISKWKTSATQSVRCLY